MEKTCGNCRFWDLETAASNGGTVKRAPCLLARGSTVESDPGCREHEFREEGNENED